MVSPPSLPLLGAFSCVGDLRTNEGRACHVGLTAGEGVALSNVVQKQPAPGAAGLRPPPIPHPCRCLSVLTQSHWGWLHHVLSEEARTYENSLYFQKEPRGEPQPAVLLRGEWGTERVGTQDDNHSLWPLMGTGTTYSTMLGPRWGTRASYCPQQAEWPATRSGLNLGVRLTVGRDVLGWPPSHPSL